MKTLKARIALLFLALALLAGGWGPAARAAEGAMEPAAYREAVAGMVKTAQGQAMARGAARGGGAVVLFRTDGTAPDLTDFSAAEVARGSRNRFAALLPDAASAEACVSWLVEQPYVLYAEADGVTQEAGSIAYKSWAAEAMGFEGLDLRALQGSGSVLVAVADSGTYRHSKLSGRIGRLGYDYVDLDEDPTNDLNGHGTHVSGIVVDCTPNLPVMLMPIRVLNNSGSGSTANLISAIDEAVEAGADIINISIVLLGHSDALHEAIGNAVSSGTTVVLAAGNKGIDVSGTCPAHIATHGVVVVDSVSRQGGGSTLESYSNYGASVDVSAYGTGVVSCSIGGGYESMTGTSMAAPHISAACALIRLICPSMGPARQEAVLRAIRAPSGGGAAGVVRLERLMPEYAGVGTGALTLPVGAAFGLSDAQGIGWSTADAQVASVGADGVLRAEGVGETALAADVQGFPVASVALRVADENTTALPAALKALAAGSLEGSGLTGLCYLPETLESIGARAFADCDGLTALAFAGMTASIDPSAFEGSENLVLLCAAESDAMAYAANAGMPYLEASPAE